MSNSKYDEYFNITFQGEFQKSYTVKMWKYVFSTQLSQIYSSALPTYLLRKNACRYTNSCQLFKFCVEVIHILQNI